MKIGIMQPYFFPYLGYFQLVQAVDRFVIYDDVNYINRSWISRNFILGKQGPERLTLELLGASQNKLINSIEIGSNVHKLIAAISHAYSKAPYFSAAFPIIETCLTCPEKNLARFLEFSLRGLCTYLGIQTEIVVSSQIEKNNSLKGSEKIIAICNRLGGDLYINAIGGQALYNRDYFHQRRLQLLFIQMGEIVYPQLRVDFVPNLSVIDVMMFNSLDQISNFLQEYTLV